MKQLLRLLQLSDDEKLVLVGDDTSDWLIDALAYRASSVYMLDEHARPLRFVPEDLKDLLSQADVLLYVITKKTSVEREFQDALTGYAESLGVRVGNLFSVTPEILASALRADVDEVRRHTLALRDEMSGIRRVRVTSPAGTDVTLDIDGSVWLASTGFVEFQKTRNLIPAEVYTYPLGVEGIIVVDGAYAPIAQHSNSAELLERLQKFPLTWVVKDSRIVEVHCLDEELRELCMHEVFERDPENGNRIGEFGIGTNSGIDKLFGNVMHDEKYPGVHIAHGHGYPSATGAPYTSSVHADGILLDASVVDAESEDPILI